MSRKMKDSGVEWIGEIPEEWNVSRMKHEFDMGMGKTILKSDLHEDGQIPVYSATEQDKLFGKIFTAELMLTRGDMVVSARGTIGSVKYITGESTCTQTTIYLKPKRYRSKFQYYYLLGARKHVFPYSDTAVPQLTITDLQAQFMIIPPLSEQQAIADYLDTKVGEIDTNISKLKSASALLSELKQSVIYEAVTGKTFEGKVIDRKMKDSGVEWIGEIPEEWSTRRLKNIISLRKGKAPVIIESNEVFPYIDVKALRTGVHDHVASAGVKVLKGSLLILCDGSKSGAVFTSLCEGYLGSTLSVIAHKPMVLQSYLTRWLEVYQPIFQTNMIGAGIPHLDTDMLKLLHITTPPLSEQQAIADYLDRKVGEIDNKISIIERKIELLAELKQSVIYEAVTGKIDMRTMDAPANTYNTNKVA